MRRKSALDYNLTVRELRFVDMFAATFNPIESAKQAGYKRENASAMASRLLSDFRIQKALQQRLELAATFENLTPSYVLRGLREIYERCMQMKPIVDKFGVPVGTYTFEPMPAIKALELIGKNFDMFSPDVVVNMNVEIDQELAGARQRALTRIAGDKIKDITDETKALNSEEVDKMRFPGFEPKKDSSYDARFKDRDQFLV
jgi:phage terminase small subunit